MLKYYICEDVNSEEAVYVTVVEDLEKGDLVVIMEFGRPCLAKVVKEMDELEAITSETEWFESLAHVSVKEYYEKRKAEIEKQKLLTLMKKEIELNALEEKLKKNAEINSRMSDLFNHYKTLCETE